MNAEKWLAKLFDYQKFEQDPKLQAVIGTTLKSVQENRALEDSEADIWAAGEAQSQYYDARKRKND